MKGQKKTAIQASWVAVFFLASRGIRELRARSALRVGPEGPSLRDHFTSRPEGAARRARRALLAGGRRGETPPPSAVGADHSVGRPALAQACSLGVGTVGGTPPGRSSGPRPSVRVPGSGSFHFAPGGRCASGPKGPPCGAFSRRAPSAFGGRRRSFGRAACACAGLLPRCRHRRGHAAGAHVRPQALRARAGLGGGANGVIASPGLASVAGPPLS